MTKKKLDTAGISQDLEGVVSLFARQDRQPAVAHAPLPLTEENTPSEPLDSKRPAAKKAAKKPRNRDTTTPRHRVTTQPSNHESVEPTSHETVGLFLEGEVVEAIRLAVKQLGEKAATYRFTAEEKKALADVVYTYKRGGVKTSENEITRIALNFIMEDYRRNGQTSVLAAVLARLNA